MEDLLNCRDISLMYNESDISRIFDIMNTILSSELHRADSSGLSDLWGA